MAKAMRFLWAWKICRERPRPATRRLMQAEALGVRCTESRNRGVESWGPGICRSVTAIERPSRRPGGNEGGCCGLLAVAAGPSHGMSFCTRSRSFSASVRNLEADARLFQIPLNDRSGAKFGFRPWLHHAEFTSSELTTSTSNIATVVDIVVTVILARSDSISCVTMFCTVVSWAEAEMPKNQTEKADSADPKPNAIGANPT